LRIADPQSAIQSDNLIRNPQSAIRVFTLNPTIVKLLLTCGANPRIVGEYGETPLTQAVSGGALSDLDRPLLGGCRLATVRALLEHDPELKIPDTYAGRSAIWWARFHGCADVLATVGAHAGQRAKS